MTMYNAPHESRDEEKVASLVEAMRTGQSIPPIVVNGDTAICGSHRIEAAVRADRLREGMADGWEDTPEIDLPTVEVEDSVIYAAYDKMHITGLDEIGDWNEFCSVVRDICDDDEVKTALSDQV